MPFCIKIKQVSGHFPDCLFDLVFCGGPCLAAQLIQFRFFIGKSLVLIDYVDPVNRHVKPVIALVSDIQKIVGHILDCKIDQTLVRAQTMLAMNNDITYFKFFKSDRCFPGPPFFLFSGPDSSFSEQLTLRQDVKPFLGQVESFGQRVVEQQNPICVLNVRCKRRAVKSDRQVVMREKFCKMFCVAKRPACDKDPVSPVQPA